MADALFARPHSVRTPGAHFGHFNLVIVCRVGWGTFKSSCSMYDSAKWFALLIQEAVRTDRTIIPARKA
jgi:hypothetical protein